MGKKMEVAAAKKTYTRVCSVCGEKHTYIHKNKPVQCPSCGAHYWDKPKDERELFELQDVYFNNGKREDDLVAIYNKVRSYSRNIILGKIRNKFKMPDDMLDDKTDELATKFLERILTYSDDPIRQSFGAMLQWMANGVLYGKHRNEEDHVSLQSVLESGSSLEDTLKYFTDDYESIQSHSVENAEEKVVNDDGEKILNVTNRMIYTIGKRLRELSSSSEDSLLFIIGMKHHMSAVSDKFMREYYDYCGNKTKGDIEKAKKQIRHYLTEVRAHG